MLPIEMARLAFGEPIEVELEDEYDYDDGPDDEEEDEEYAYAADAFGRGGKANIVKKATAAALGKAKGLRGSPKVKKRRGGKRRRGSKKRGKKGASYRRGRASGVTISNKMVEYIILSLALKANH